MPIFLKDFSLIQSSQKVSLQLTTPIPFLSKNVTLLHSDLYLRLSHPPYFFELFFEHKVKLSETRCIFDHSTINFEFVKETEDIWTDLKTFNFQLSSNEKRERRNEAIDWRQKYELEQYRKALTDERNRERLGISKSIDADEDTRQKIESKKSEIRAEFESEISKNISEFWNDNQTTKESKLSNNEDQTNQSKETKSKNSNVTPKYNTVLARKVAEEKLSRQNLLPPRQSATILIDLTPRNFPAPLRESKTEEEENWSRKRFETLRKNVLDENGVEESNVESVLKKGEEFFLLQDYLSAHNIYTYGIEKISSDCGALFSNRAACHLKLGNYEKVLEDTSKAIDLFNPPVESNKPARAKAMIRRGSALAELGLYSEAIIEFESAAKLLPDKREEIDINIEKIRQLMENND